MTAKKSRTSMGWAWLLALPILCCAGHDVLLAVGAGSLAAVVGGATGSALLTAVLLVAVIVAAVAPAVLALRRRRAR